MPKGGHIRGGPIAHSVAEKQRLGRTVRRQNREKGRPGTVSAATPPPPHLTAVELEQWDYYAPLLAASQRLTREARDTLAKYCTALAEIVRIKTEMAIRGEDGQPIYRSVMVTVTIDGSGAEHVSAKPNPLGVLLRQWITICRGYENDLLLCPAAAVRVPAPESAVGADDEFGLTSAGPKLVKR